MSIETALYTTLANDAGVTAITDRIFIGEADENTAKPYIAAYLITRANIDTLPGVGDMHRKLMQISCHASTYAAAKTLADAVIAALEGDGYLQNEVDFHSIATATHTVHIDWSFLA